MAETNSQKPTEAWREEFTSDVLGEALVKENSGSVEKTAGSEAAHRSSEKLTSTAETFAAEAAQALAARMGQKWGVNRPDLLYVVAKDFCAAHSGTFNMEYVFMAYSYINKKNLPTFRITQEDMDEAYGSIDEIWQKAKNDPQKQQGSFKKFMYDNCVWLPQKTWDQRFGKWYQDGNSPLNDEALGDLLQNLNDKDAGLPPAREVVVDDRSSEQIAKAIEIIAKVKLPVVDQPAIEAASVDNLNRVDKSEELHVALVESTKIGTEEEQGLLANLLLKVSRHENLTQIEYDAVNQLYMSGRYPASARVFLALMFA